MIVAGVDPGSKNTGVAIVECGQIRNTYTLHPTCQEALSPGKIHSLFNVGVRAGQMFRSACVDVVAVEEPIIGQARGILPVVSAWAAIVAGIYETIGWDVKFVRMHIGTWKKSFVGKGNATKSDIAAAVAGVGIDEVLLPLTQDQMDAIGIAFAAVDEVAK
jgi:Holliday junction resolvasome RuvABC endonuclease subunit